MPQAPPTLAPADAAIVLASAAHAPTLHAWRDDPYARRYNPFDLSQDLAATAARLQASGHDPSAGWLPEHTWVLLGPEGQPWGQVSLSPNPRMGLMELGYSTAPEARGRGVAGTLIRHALARGFAAGGRKAYAMVAASNVASRRVMEKLGFQQEGILRLHYLIEGVPHDEVSYGLLASEWASRQAN